MYDVLIVGAGCVGAFIARNCSKYGYKTLVIEKQNDVGNGVSNANSAIVHSGYDPVPGTMKAKMNVKGNQMFDTVASELDVTFKRIGSMTVATEEGQLKLLKDLVARAQENGVPCQLLSKEEALAKEPNLGDNIIQALFCPTAGIVDPFNLVVHAMENAVDNGVELHLNEEVKGIQKDQIGYLVTTSKAKYSAKIVVNAAGLYADKISDMVMPHHFEINPRKGEYYVLDHFNPNYLNTVIFPLPSEKGKGILVSPTSSQNYIVGPSSEFQDSKEDNGTDSPTLQNVKLQASGMMKEIPFNQCIRTFAGIRPTPSTHDFIFEEQDGFINAAGVESPGLVSSPAIGEYIVETYIQKLLPREARKDYNPNVKRYIRMKYASAEEKAKAIKENPKYGHIVCKCESITEGEILDALSRSVPPHSIKAVKKRTRAGFGKCQGGMCQPLVLALLKAHYNLKQEDVLYDNENSNICIEDLNK